MGANPIVPDQSDQSDQSEQSGVPTSLPKGAVAAAMVGQTLEWYDFAVYGYFALIIGEKFFATQTPVVQLLASFAVFGSGYVMRPVGAAVMGHLGDRYGRKNAFSFALLAMSLATFLVGVIPTYATIGVLAPALLTVLRLVQGFSNGGEFGGSVTFLTESAPPRRRGFFGSFQQMTLALGLLLGASVSIVLTNAMSEAALHAWGWRVPFVAGVVLGVPGYLIRRRMQDTVEFRRLVESGETVKNPLRETVNRHWRDMLKTFPLPNSPAYYVLMVYLPTYLETQAGYTRGEALQTTLILQIAYIVMTPLAGLLSDRVGRKPVLLSGYVLAAVLIYPVFLVINAGSHLAAGFAVLPVSLALALMFGPLATTVTEMFPAQVRYSAVSIPYNLHAAVLGGFTPFVATYLVDVTGTATAPALLVVGAVVLSFLAVRTYPEVAGRPLR